MAKAAEARELLRLDGKNLPSASACFDLADGLKDLNEFGLARHLFARIIEMGDAADLDRSRNQSPLKALQKGALCTYKDRDLLAAHRFDKALELLGEADALPQSIAERQESYGLKGAVYKRRWQTEGRRGDLEQALQCYREGYMLGPELDAGYTGINAAYVIDLLAKEQASQLWTPASRQEGTAGLRAEADGIRRRIIDLLSARPREMTSDGKLAPWPWWFHATLAEAHFGLGEYGPAVASLRAYGAERGLDTGLPTGEVPPWVFESTITQLAALAQVRATLAALMDGAGDVARRAEELLAPARTVLREFLGTYAPGADRAFAGKLGLALSGGGFRASFFHIGVLAYLAERDVLRHVEVLSCVSGGSIVGAHYYLEIRHLLKTRLTLDASDYIGIVHRLREQFLKGVEGNLRCKVYAGVWSNLRAFLQPGYTTTHRLAELYESDLYARVEDGEGRRPRLMRDLVVRPAGEEVDFRPEHDNWRRADKVPILVLNAATLNTGHSWQFTTRWMGEPPGAIDPAIDGNFRLRRLRYGEAPPDEGPSRWWQPRQWSATRDHQGTRLGTAVAASSCVPGLFAPLILAGLYERGDPRRDVTVQLVDGGVYDNQGIASLLEQDCARMIVSDASGQMDAVERPIGGRLGVVLRSFSISQARVRHAQYRELEARHRSGVLKDFMFLHLRKGLVGDAVNSRTEETLHGAGEAGSSAGARREPEDEDADGHEAGEGVRDIPPRVQRLLSAIRTDLDAFTEVEAFALMTNGYQQAKAQLEASMPGLATRAEGGVSWPFLAIEDFMTGARPGSAALEDQLDVAAAVGGKVWRRSAPLRIILGLLGVGAVAALAGIAWVNRSRELLTVGRAGVLLLVMAAFVLLPRIVRWLRFRETLLQVGLGGALAVVLAFAFKLYLRGLNGLYVERGRLQRLMGVRQEGG